MPYQSVTGLNNAGTLSNVTPQPASPDGYQQTAVFAASGIVKIEGRPYTVWSYASVTRADYNTLRTKFGLSDTVFSAQNTIRTKRNDDTFANYNCTIVHVPGENGKRGFSFPTDVQFIIKDMEAI